MCETDAQALDVVLCWGGIDRIRKRFDDESFLQRYTPRRARSIWSQVNRGRMARLTAAKRMKPPGQRRNHRRGKRAPKGAMISGRPIKFHDRDEATRHGAFWRVFSDRAPVADR